MCGGRPSGLGRLSVVVASLGRPACQAVLVAGATVGPVALGQIVTCTNLRRVAALYLPSHRASTRRISASRAIHTHSPHPSAKPSPASLRKTAPSQPPFLPTTVMAASTGTLRELGTYRLNGCVSSQVTFWDAPEDDYTALGCDRVHPTDPVGRTRPRPNRGLAAVTA